MDITALTSDLKSKCKDLVVHLDAEQRDLYGQDWTKHYKVDASAVLLPKTHNDVVEIVKWAKANKVALVPSGGRTGLSAAAYATQGEVIVSFERMNQILEYDAFDQTLRVEPGVITESIQEAAAEKGLFYPVDFAASGSSQIGGNVATNAGGIKVLRYGMTRQWVTGLKVVTGSGETLELNNSLVKNATGYDLMQLFIGSEGTLGFVTEVTLKLTRPPKEDSVLLLVLQDMDSVMKVYHEFQTRFPLTAFEMMSDVALDCVLKAGHVSYPLESRGAYYVVIEAEKSHESDEELLLSAFEACMEKGWVIDGTMSQNSQQAKDFWRLREDISECLAPYSPYKNDVSVRISKVPEFLTEADDILKKNYPDYPVVWFGHIGDGNLHINILKPESESSDDFVNKCKTVNDDLFSMIKKHKGSVSAEHGVGLVKKPYLHLTRSEHEIQLMKQIKALFDPDQIMNPGKVF